MYIMELSRLTKLPLRDAWKHEAIDFTNWLASEENLQLLSESIGIELSNAQTEVGVGYLYADLFQYFPSISFINVFIFGIGSSAKTV